VVNGGKIIDMLEEISMITNAVDFAIARWLREHYVEPFASIYRIDGLIVTDAETITWGELEKLLRINDIPDLPSIMAGESSPPLDRGLVPTSSSSSSPEQKFTPTSNAWRTPSPPSDDIHLVGGDDEAMSASESSSELEFTPESTAMMKSQTLSLSPSVADGIEVEEEVKSSLLSSTFTMSSGDWE
jgi:hypothetical protein